MKNRPLGVTMLAAVLWLLTAACYADEPRQVLFDEAGDDPLCVQQPAGLDVDSCLEADDADIAWRCVAQLVDPEQACPAAPPNWNVRRLFATPGIDDSPPLPRGLRGFCAFETTLSQPQPCAALDSPQFVAVDADSMAVVALADSLQSLSSEALREHFLLAAGQAAVPVAGNDAGPPPVRIAIADTQASSATPWLEPSSRSGHGHALVHMARDLVCRDATNCGVEVTTELALPYTCFERAECDALVAANACSDVRGCPDPQNGGFLGTPVTVAEAIHRAVVTRRTGLQERLIINLSVGWDPLFDERATGGTRSGTQAVIEALKEATCRGAIVFAAAGNRFGGPQRQTGPLSPARFETFAAPGEAECNAFLAPQTVAEGADFVSGVSRPLVHAVSSVRADNSTVLTRAGGEPALVAFGDHAAANTEPGAGQRYSETLTGTSVGSLVAAAAGASSWYYARALPPATLVDNLYASGSTVPSAVSGASRVADFCLSQPCAPAHRIDVCRAVAARCASGGSGCPAQSTLTCPPLYATQPIVPRDDIAALYEATAVADEAVRTLSFVQVADACAAGDYKLNHDGSADAAVPCPHVQYHAIQATPWVRGQPDEQNCPNCGTHFSSPGSLYVEIPESFGYDLDDGTLVCGAQAFRLSRLLRPGQRYRLSDVPESCIGEGLTLGFKISDGGRPASTVSDIMIITADSDSDGLPDSNDNCTAVANPDQLDTDGDAIGNACDPDIATPNDCLVNFLDLAAMRAAFFSSAGSAGWNADADFNGDGVINFFDLVVLRAAFFGPPGPSASGCN
ncbi:MAG: hypothetical protein AAGD86_02085 [Pseudomonadota bacterium]